MDRRNGLVTNGRQVKSAIPSRGGDEGIVQAAKAIYDQVKTLLTQHKAEVDARIKLFEDSLNVRFGKVLESEFGKALAGEFDKRLPALVVEFQGQVAELRNSYQFGLEQMQNFLRSLPVPNVNVSLPEMVAQVNVPELRNPDIHVNVPEAVIQVNPTPFTFQTPEVKAPDVHVTLPEQRPVFNVPQQKAPVVNFTPPKQEASIVNVTVPKRKVKKTFTYDEATGRPLNVVEEEVEINETQKEEGK